MAHEPDAAVLVADTPTFPADRQPFHGYDIKFPQDGRVITKLESLNCGRKTSLRWQGPRLPRWQKNFRPHLYQNKHVKSLKV